LGPAISHAYHLRYDEDERICVIEKGYFWQAQELELVHAGE
jgi:hypothetical protein